MPAVVPHDRPEVSEARKIAARRNGARSKGPITNEGKNISRRNSIKHGMCCTVLTPHDDTAEVEGRARGLRVEMAPRSIMGRFLVGRLAELTVRVERCSKQERAAVKNRADHAVAAFDEARLTEADHLISHLAVEPVTYVRRLRATPEGVDRLIAALLDLRAELEYGDQTHWDFNYGMNLAVLTGSRYMDSPTPRARALTQALAGNFKDLRADEGEGLSDADRRAWALWELVKLIDDELAELVGHRETLDFEAIESDRATAADRALFDPSKEAILARRYEAAAERGVYKALAELRRVEAEAAERGVEPEETEESLGSSGSEEAEASPPPPPTIPGVPSRSFGRVERCNEGPQSVERGRFGTA